MGTTKSQLSCYLSAVTWKKGESLNLLFINILEHHFATTQGSSLGVVSIGPKEADKNVRHFSEDQLRAGQAIISLQYGSNKGANQSGINFGNTRHM